MEPHETGNFEPRETIVQLVNQQSAWKGEKFRKGPFYVLFGGKWSGES